MLNTIDASNDNSVLVPQRVYIYIYIYILECETTKLFKQSRSYIRVTFIYFSKHIINICIKLLPFSLHINFTLFY